MKFTFKVQLFYCLCVLFVHKNDFYPILGDIKNKHLKGLSGNIKQQQKV